MSLWDYPNDKTTQKFFCLVCKMKHSICFICRSNINLLNDSIVIQCCNKCHINKKDDSNNGQWKNKMLLSNNYKQLQYPTWIRSSIIALFICSNRMDITEKYRLPPELWNYIYKCIRLNDVGRKYPFHNYIVNYYNRSNPKVNYCDKCSQYHYMEDGNILNVIEKYPKEIATKIVFLIWYVTEDRHNKLGYKYFKVYNEKNITYDYKKFCEKTIIITENTDPKIIKFLNENDINTNNYSYDGIKMIYKNIIIDYIKTLK